METRNWIADHMEDLDHALRVCRPERRAECFWKHTSWYWVADLGQEEVSFAAQRLIDVGAKYRIKPAPFAPPESQSYEY